MQQNSVDITEALRSLTIKDLRQQCRARGLSPAGGFDVLHGRVADHMRETNDLKMHATVDADHQNGQEDDSFRTNNYSRPGGNQNLGNKITNRASSRVLAPPGGASQISWGEEPTPVRKAAEQVLDKMGLGDTDSVVAGRPSQAPGLPSTHDTSARLFTNNGTPAATPTKVTTTGGGGLSQVAFGEYQLPSYVAEHGGKDVNVRDTSATDSMVVQVDSLVKSLTLPQLRTELRNRNLSPAGGIETLRARLGEHMIATGSVGLTDAAPASGTASAAAPASPSTAQPTGYLSNNYQRPGGSQNVGNFINDGRPSSRVLAPPGGKSQITFG